MSNTIFEIIEFNFDKDNITTNITIKLSYDNTSVLYVLTIPSNPVCEIELLNLNKKDINKVTKKLNKIIINKEFSFKTNEALKKLYSWIFVILNPEQELAY